MKITKYEILTEKHGIDLRIAVVSDLHARPYGKALKALEAVNPDLILLPGDILEVATAYREERNQNALSFLQCAVKIAPVYYCYGNHELYNSHAKHGKAKESDPKIAEKYRKAEESMGVHLINDRFEAFSNPSTPSQIKIGGMVCGRDMNQQTSDHPFDSDFLKTFSAETGFKILLCHYPHYYEPYIKEHDIDLILSGHAHGGQWRIFGHGIYAPHQGLFPKYTSGIHEGRHIISRGAANNTRPIPRFFNPCEILEIHIKSK